MDEPVKRVQSPISTASPNAVVTWMPRRHINASTTGGVAAGSGRGGDLFVDACQMPGEEFGLLYIGLVGAVQRRFGKALAVQPPAVFPRPSGLFQVADAVAQQDGVHALAGVREIFGRARAQPGQVPEGFFVRVRDPHLGDRADREHLSQHPGVRPVGFHPSPGAPSSFDDAATTQLTPAARR